MTIWTGYHKRKMEFCDLFADAVREEVERLAPDGGSARHYCGMAAYKEALETAVEYEILRRPNSQYERMKGMTRPTTPEKLAEVFAAEMIHKYTRAYKEALTSHLLRLEKIRLEDPDAGVDDEYKEAQIEFMTAFPRHPLP